MEDLKKSVKVKVKDMIGEALKNDGSKVIAIRPFIFEIKAAFYDFDGLRSQYFTYGYDLLQFNFNAFSPDRNLDDFLRGITTTQRFEIELLKKPYYRTTVVDVERPTLIVFLPLDLRQSQNVLVHLSKICNLYVKTQSTWYVFKDLSRNDQIWNTLQKYVCYTTKSDFFELDIELINSDTPEKQGDTSVRAPEESCKIFKVQEDIDKYHADLKRFVKDMFLNIFELAQDGKSHILVMYYDGGPKVVAASELKDCEEATLYSWFPKTYSKIKSCESFPAIATVDTIVYINVKPDVETGHWIPKHPGISIYTYENGLLTDITKTNTSGNTTCDIKSFIRQIIK